MLKNDLCRLKSAVLSLMFAICFCSSCAHPLFDANERTVSKVSRTFETDANESYNAIRWALKTNGYNIKNEDLQNGVITSGWLPAKVNSFYVAPFDRPDYGVNGAYYQFEINIVPEDGKTRVEIVSHVKSIVAHLKSSEIEEKKILSKISDYLRSDVKVTNIGAE